MTAAGMGAADAARDAGSWRSPGRLPVHAAVTCGVFVCYILGRLLEGGAGTVFAAIGASACGWAWLLARALFDPGRRDAWWPRVVGFVVVASGAVSTLATGDGVVSRVADNAYVLSGSAALLMTFVEPFNRYRTGLPAEEKRFRFAFLLVYGLLVGASILEFRLWGVADVDRVKAACALVGLAAALAATGFRLHRPLPGEAPPATRRAPTAEDARLGERLLGLLRDKHIHLQPDLRIAEVAARLGQPEYRLSQSIPALGFPNFNRLINHHRIERAKEMLSDPQDDRSVLEIAFDCGFASLGPFNRAFRDQVGTTPRGFRRCCRMR